MATVRSVTAYMVLPRPGDVSKWVIVPMCFLTTVLLVGAGNADSWSRALVVWMVLEFLLYQARYQWNDIRGFVADQRHPSSADRGRLPGPIHKVRSRVGVSAAVIALRLALAFAVAAALPTLQLWPWVIGLLVAVFGVAMVYEFLRSKATGYSDVVPSPLRPSLIALWVFVGAGYAVRGLTGLMLALPDPSAPAIPAAFVMLWAFGVSWVTARWALESLPFGRQVDGRIYWTVKSDHAREHTMALVRWLPVAASEPGVDGDLRTWRALSQGTSMRAPWNIAITVALAAATVTGQLLVEPDATGSADQMLAIAAVGGLLGIAVAKLRPAQLVAIPAGATLIALCLTWAGVARPVSAALPWAVIALAAWYYTRQDAASLGQLPKKIGRATRRGISLSAAPTGKRILRWFLGSQTYDMVLASEKPPNPPSTTLGSQERNGRGPKAEKVTWSISTD